MKRDNKKKKNKDSKNDIYKSFEGIALMNEMTGGIPANPAQNYDNDEYVQIYEIPAPENKNNDN